MVDKKIDLLITNIGTCITVSGPDRPRVNEEMQELGEIHGAAIAISDGKILCIGTVHEVMKEIQGMTVIHRINAGGKLVTPGLVDPHTHLVHAGSREHELAMKLEGIPYMEILARGGGILRTVRDTLEASEAELVQQGFQSLNQMLLHGTTTVEAKSGYGLTVEGELKQLRVAKELDSIHPIDLVHTFLGAHAIPLEYRDNPDRYVEIVINEMIPAVAEEQLAEFCDVFCEHGVFTVDQSRRILQQAAKYGMKLKLHADELEPFGGAELAAELGCVSADHLVAASDAGLIEMKNKGVIAVLLPATSFNLCTGKYARARRMIELGLPVALSTDYNPGSSPTESMQMVMTLACLQLRMLPAEVIVASTINAAYAIGRGREIGSLETGKKADILIWNAPNIQYIPYHFGINHVHTVIKNGKIVVENGSLRQC